MVDGRLLFVFVGSIAGGAIQSVTGFGCGVLLMIFLPALYGVLKASAISSAICIVLTASLAIRFRQHLKAKKLLVPGIIYLGFCNTAIWLAPSLNTSRLILAFGAFLVLLSVYFYFVQNHVRPSPNAITNILASSLSGVSAGLFGIGGPLMAPVFLGVSKSKEEYVALIDTLFAVSTIISLASRAIRGIYTIDLIPATFAGMLGVIIGKKVGFKVLDKINIETMSKIIYLMIGISGMLTIISNL